VPIYGVLIGATMLVSFYGGRALQMWCDTFDEEVYGEKENDKG
jgi:hypothetical protein